MGPGSSAHHWIHQPLPATHDMKLSLSIALTAALLLAAVSPARAGSVSINFDVNAGGQSIVAPATFDNGSPLGNLYAALGVHFSGPTPETGGYILNDSTFTSKAHSGVNFLAFTAGLGPETITFDSLQAAASIYASSLSHAMTFRLEAFDAGGALLDSQAISTSSPGYSQLGVASSAGIKKLVLTVLNNPGGNAYVFDDLVATSVGSSAPWIDLGSGLGSGTWGTPNLVGAGLLAAGSAGSLTLAHARPGALALLFASVASSPAAFKGGTLVPLPSIATLVLVTNASGGVSLPWAAWPAGLAPGSNLYLQYAIDDATGPAGATLSNAIKGTTP
jgi:hypothetical protein